MKMDQNGRRSLIFASLVVVGFVFSFFVFSQIPSRFALAQVDGPSPSPRSGIPVPASSPGDSNLTGNACVRELYFPLLFTNSLEGPIFDPVHAHFESNLDYSIQWSKDESPAIGVENDNSWGLKSETGWVWIWENPQPEPGAITDLYLYPEYAGELILGVNGSLWYFGEQLTPNSPNSIEVGPIPLPSHGTHQISVIYANRNIDQPTLRLRARNCTAGHSCQSVPSFFFGEPSPPDPPHYLYYTQKPEDQTELPGSNRSATFSMTYGSLGGNVNSQWQEQQALGSQIWRDVGVPKSSTHTVGPPLSISGNNGDKYRVSISNNVCQFVEGLHVATLTVGSPTPTPPTFPPLECVGPDSLNPNQLGTYTATGGDTAYTHTWSTNNHGGDCDSCSSIFSTRFEAPHVNHAEFITVARGQEIAVCSTVIVPRQVTCSGPAETGEDQPVVFTTTGGVPGSAYTWTSNGHGMPHTCSDQSEPACEDTFLTTFTSGHASEPQPHIVTIDRGPGSEDQAECEVVVTEGPQCLGDCEPLVCKAKRPKGNAQSQHEDVLPGPGNEAEFTVEGGGSVPNYQWSSDHGTPNSDTGRDHSPYFPSSEIGNVQTITVVDDQPGPEGQVAYCFVKVVESTNPDMPTCRLSPSENPPPPYHIGQKIVFEGTGAGGPQDYVWEAEIAGQPTPRRCTNRRDDGCGPQYDKGEFHVKWGVAGDPNSVQIYSKDDPSKFSFCSVTIELEESPTPTPSCGNEECVQESSMYRYFESPENIFDRNMDCHNTGTFPFGDDPEHSNPECNPRYFEHPNSPSTYGTNDGLRYGPLSDNVLSVTAHDAHLNVKDSNADLKYSTFNYTDIFSQPVQFVAQLNAYSHVLSALSDFSYSYWPIDGYLLSDPLGIRPFAMKNIVYIIDAPETDSSKCVLSSDETPTEYILRINSHCALDSEFVRLSVYRVLLQRVASIFPSQYLRDTSEIDAVKEGLASYYSLSRDQYDATDLQFLGDYAYAKTRPQKSWPYDLPFERVLDLDRVYNPNTQRRENDPGHASVVHRNFSNNLEEIQIRDNQIASILTEVKHSLPDNSGNWDMAVMTAYRRFTYQAALKLELVRTNMTQMFYIYLYDVMLKGNFTDRDRDVFLSVLKDYAKLKVSIGNYQQVVTHDILSSAVCRERSPGGPRYPTYSLWVPSVNAVGHKLDRLELEIKDFNSGLVLEDNTYRSFGRQPFVQDHMHTPVEFVDDFLQIPVQGPITASLRLVAYDEMNNASQELYAIFAIPDCSG